MPTAKKMPSGSWKVRVYSHIDSDGKQHYKSFTAPTKKEAERLALSYTAGQDTRRLTLEQAMEEYTESRSSTLSPRTITDYKSYRKNYYGILKKKDIMRITQTDIQRAINIEAANLSPKTLRNIHGFLVAVLHTYRPDFQINTTLPQKKATTLYIPSEDDVTRLMAAVKGTNMELPVLLAAFGPMRRGEICALQQEDINGNIVHVCRNMVKSNDTDVWRIKSPKSYAGDRYIEFPDFVREVWEKSGLVTICPDTITKRFGIILAENGIPHFRFHDLRHYSASIQHALGVPDVYIMRRGGWSNDGTLKQIYRHALEQEAVRQNAVINRHFTELHDPDHDPDIEEARKNGLVRMEQTGIEPVQAETPECPKIQEPPENKDITAVIKTDISAKN